jgi:hypothetical protein
MLIDVAKMLALRPLLSACRHQLVPLLTALTAFQSGPANELVMIRQGLLGLCLGRSVSWAGVVSSECVYWIAQLMNMAIP